MRQELQQIFHKFIGDPYIPELRITDVVEILIIAVIVYEIMLWIKNTKAWMLLKGLLMLGLFILVAYVFRMHAILYLARESISILAFFREASSPAGLQKTLPRDMVTMIS